MTLDEFIAQANQLVADRSQQVHPRIPVAVVGATLAAAQAVCDQLAARGTLQAPVLALAQDSDFPLVRTRALLLVAVLDGVTPTPGLRAGLGRAVDVCARVTGTDPNNLLVALSA